MKHLKITSVLLSALMCASMVMTPVPVVADQTAATSETQKIEETVKEKPGRIAEDKVEAVNGTATYKDVLIVGGLKYRVTSAAINGTGTVKLIGAEDQVANVSIPNTITVQGMVYKVTAIGEKAFLNNQTIKSLNIGSNVLSIEDQAFSGCTKLVSVIGGSRLKTIGAKTFVGCPKLKTFNITSSVLSKIGPYSFFGDGMLKTLQIKKTTKLTKAGVKNSLKGSFVKTVKVKKSKIKKYKKFFKKNNSGRKVTVKK
ncbi:MAG: leucine-rich repeat domain-containing protein [Clostridiales bacterium]|nr:leucine-rich repeat domain-containing protein [Clostridiales bacterium]